MNEIIETAPPFDSNIVLRKPAAFGVFTGNGGFLANLPIYLIALGDQLLNFDADDKGADDFAGHLLVYSAEVIASVSNNEDLPELPTIIKEGTSDKLSVQARFALRTASTLLSIYQMTITDPKKSKALRYVVQAIRSLLSGKPVEGLM